MAAVGIGNLIAQLGPYSIMIGVGSALESLVSAAYGRRNLKEAGLYWQRAILLCSLLYVPILFILVYSETLLIRIGIDPKIALYASQFLNAQRAALFFHAICEQNVLFMVAVDRGFVVMLL